MLSPPSRRRGLKLCKLHSVPMGLLVASLAEAWIETSDTVCPMYCSRSPPSRRRGLKPGKHYAEKTRKEVASLAEAWIETDNAEEAA